MRISLIGYGKMGKEIEKIALERGHQIALRISKDSDERLQDINQQNTDVAIEFTSPKSAAEHVRYCVDNKINIVCGSTGWNEQKVLIERKLKNAPESGFFWASNFSIGVHLFLRINAYAAKLLSDYQDYSLGIEEIHHTQKKDAPSGTAITLAEEILKNYEPKTDWKLTEKDNFALEDNGAIPIKALRQEDVKGTHTAHYQSEIDDIVLTHRAHSRAGFAKGAVMAAEFLANKKGVFGMKDLLK